MSTWVSSALTAGSDRVSRERPVSSVPNALLPSPTSKHPSVMEVCPMADRILLRSIEFYGYHGVAEAERLIGHRFSADVALTTDLERAGAIDDLDATVDYGEVCRCVLAV